MPELPEIETISRGLQPQLHGQRILDLLIIQPKLRWKVSENLQAGVSGQVIREIARRGKYLLLRVGEGTVLIHLGMSGCLFLDTAKQRRRKHDHLEFVLEDGRLLRFNDPRRFGCVLWTENYQQHRLIVGLGVEPLSNEFCQDLFLKAAKRRKIAIKQLLMDSKLVVGIGNIYACEALFASGIHPLRKCDRISGKRLNHLQEVVKKTLKSAIASGGTTLKDFHHHDGRPGYFKQFLYVYGRKDLPCQQCSTLIKRILLAGRATYYCPQCQH